MDEHQAGSGSRTPQGRRSRTPRRSPGTSSGGQASEAAAPTHGHSGSDVGTAANADPLELLRNELNICSDATELRALLHPPRHLEGFEACHNRATCQFMLRLQPIAKLEEKAKGRFSYSLVLLEIYFLLN